MTDCIYCGFKKEKDGRAWKRNYCDNCVRDKEIGFSHVRGTVFLRNYGSESSARIKEMERRVVLNYNPKDGSYDVGRLGENGKVQEKEPTY